MSDFNRPGRLSGGLGSFQPRESVSSGPETYAEVVERTMRERDMSKVTVRKPTPEVNPFDTHNTVRVAVYCRVSSDKISQTPSFYTQQKYYLKYVRSQKGKRLVVMYCDEGISATGIVKRTGLVSLLRDAEAGRFDMVIVKDLSRLSRNLMDCMRIIYKLRRLPHPVGILFEEEKLYTLDASNDFTLQILALIAQEESHKKSDAVTRAQRMRYEMGNFMVFDVMGFRRVGVNKIDINVEEAKTLRLIFMMYLAGCNPEMIANVLNMLGRKKHTHYYVDGRVKEGEVNWTPDSVLNVLKNEKCCGDVDAQKTVTPSFLDHKAIANINSAPRYYAVDQHPVIIEPMDYYLTQKLLAANRGGWKFGLQNLGIYEDGIFAGGISSVPNWYGFGVEDYARACLRAYGIEEETLKGIEQRILDQEKQKEKKLQETEPVEIPSTFEIDSDDYENFPDEEVEECKPATAEPEKESFEGWLKKVREQQSSKNAREQTDDANATGIEYSCAELFSLNEKACITLDYRGATFNKFSFTRMNEGIEAALMQVELVYNPLEQMLIVRRAPEATPSTVNWAKESDGKYTMKRCCTKGISNVIFKTMGWNTDYKYKIVGRAFEYEGETVLVFFLDRTIKSVPAKQYTKEDVEASKKDKKKAKRMFMDGYLPDDIVLPDLDEFELGDGPLANQAKNMSSSVIYYDDRTDKEEGKLTLEDLGDEKYSAERIRHLLQRGLSPQEGWSYLKGMAVISKNCFKIFSEDLADSFGDTINNGRDARLRRYMESRKAGASTATPYGWTVGLDLPSMDTVNEAIEQLKQEMAG